GTSWRRGDLSIGARSSCRSRPAPRARPRRRDTRAIAWRRLEARTRRADAAAVRSLPCVAPAPALAPRYGAAQPRMRLVKVVAPFLGILADRRERVVHADEIGAGLCDRVDCTASRGDEALELCRLWITRVRMCHGCSSGIPSTAASWSGVSAG